MKPCWSASRSKSYPKTSRACSPVPIDPCSAMTSAGRVAGFAGTYAIQLRVRPPCSNVLRSILPSSVGLGGKEYRNAQNAKPANTTAALAIDKNAILRYLYTSFRACTQRHRIVSDDHWQRSAGADPPQPIEHRTKQQQDRQRAHRRRREWLGKDFRHKCPARRGPP